MPLLKIAKPYRSNNLSELRMHLANVEDIQRLFYAHAGQLCALSYLTRACAITSQR